MNADICRNCGKYLSPAWRDKCHHCGAPMNVARAPDVQENTYRGVSEADVLRQAEEDGARARGFGYQAVSQSWGEDGSIRTMTVMYRRVGLPTALPQATAFPQMATGRSRILAALLGIFLGGLGIHKFYTGKTLAGVIYLVFCWTLIPALIGFIEGVWYLTLSDADFARRYP